MSKIKDTLYSFCQGHFFFLFTTPLYVTIWMPVCQNYCIELEKHGKGEFEIVLMWRESRIYQLGISTGP